MTVVNPKSISGINSITTGSGSDNLLTIHTSDASSTERIRINSSGDVIVGSGITVSPDGDIFATGVTTATTFSGSGASLTNLPAANITGTLPAISGANLTNLDASDLASGTVPTARLGSGTASSSTFLRGDSTFATVTSTTINSNANNRVITGSGTADTLEAESNLTFTGSILTITNSSGASELTIVTPNNTDGGVYFNDGTNSGAVTYQHSDDSMRFRVNSTEKLRIDDYGVLRVGNTHDQTTSSNTKRIALGAKGSIWGWASGQVNGAVQLVDNYYWTGANNVAIESDHCAYLSLRSGSLRFGSTNSSQTGGSNVSGGINEKVRFQQGGGISFNGDTAAANALDDYEEGTFTPSSNATLSSSDGMYTKIGRQVTVHIRIQTSSSSSGTQMNIGNMPFTADMPGLSNGSVPNGFGYISGTVYNGGVQLHMEGNGTNCYFFNGGSSLTIANLASRDMRFGFVYTAAT